MAKKNVTLKDEASNELNPETVITQVKDSSNAALFTEASGTISTTSGHTINGASITDSSITSDKLGVLNKIVFKKTGSTDDIKIQYDANNDELHIKGGTIYLDSDVYLATGQQINDIELGSDIDGNDCNISDLNTLSVQHISDVNGSGVEIMGSVFDSDGFLTVSGILQIDDCRFNYFEHEMLLFERSGSSPNYDYNINFQGNKITDVHSIAGNNDWRIDSDGCVINDAGTEIYFRSDYFSNNIHQYCDFSTEGGAGWYLRDYRGGTEYLEIVGCSEDFTQQVQYTFKEDSIYRATKSSPNVAWSNPVDLIPHLYQHKCIINFTNGDYFSDLDSDCSAAVTYVLYNNSNTAFAVSDFLNFMGQVTLSIHDNSNTIILIMTLNYDNERNYVKQSSVWAGDVNGDDSGAISTNYVTFNDTITQIF